MYDKKNLSKCCGAAIKESTIFELAFGTPNFYCSECGKECIADTGMSELTDFECNEQRNNSRPLKVYEEGNTTIISKQSTQMGIVELTSDKEIKKVMKELAFVLMKKQDQRRKYCPLCQAQLE